MKEDNPLQASKKFRRGLSLLCHLDHAFRNDKNETGADKALIDLVQSNSEDMKAGLMTGPGNAYYYSPLPC